MEMFKKLIKDALLGAAQMLAVFIVFMCAATLLADQIMPV